MKTKHKKYIKTGLTCMVLLLFASGFTMATAEQLQNEPRIHQGLLPGQIITPDGHIINESYYENAVIKRGTFKLPSNITVEERINATLNVMKQLWITLNVSDEYWTRHVIISQMNAPTE